MAVENPYILMLASVFVLLDFKEKPSVDKLQKIMLFYLVAVLVNQLSLQHLQISLGKTSLSVSRTLVILPFLAVGFVVHRAALHLPKDLLLGWMCTCLVIVSHMMLLFLLLKKFYGYGYEHNPGVLGNLCLYILVFIFSWQQLENLPLRRCLGAILVVVFSVMTVGQR